MIISPYDTSYGKILNKGKTQDELNRYLITTDNRNLSYEYNVIDNNDGIVTNIAFITGCNNDEKAINGFEHPITVENVKRNRYVVVDLRRVLKKLDHQPLNVTEYVQDMGGYNFNIIRGVTMVDFYNGNLAMYKRFLKSFMVGYIQIYGYLINALVSLTIEEQLRVKYLLGSYCYTLFNESIENMNNNVDNIVKLLLETPIGIPHDKTVCKNVVTEFYRNMLDNGCSLETLLENIRFYLKDSRKDGFITQQLLTNSMSGMWYGPGTVETICIAMENAPTFMALVIAGLSNSSYKKSRVSMLLDKVSRGMNASTFIQDFQIFFKERMHNA